MVTAQRALPAKKAAPAKKAPAKKTTAAKAAGPADPVDAAAGAAPAVKVTLDLDALEREGDKKAPYSFRVGGEVFVLNDPREMDWQDLLIAQRTPLMFIQLCMGREVYERFLAIRIPEWAMEKLITDFFGYYGMEIGPEASALPA